jgi:hypothetical protein
MGGQRKTLDQQIVEAEKEKEDAAKRVLELRKEAKTLARKMETRRKCIIGGIIEAEAAANGDAQVLLDKAIKARIRERDKYVLPDYFPNSAGPQAEPAKPQKMTEVELTGANP